MNSRSGFVTGRSVKGRAVFLRLGCECGALAGAVPQSERAAGARAEPSQGSRGPRGRSPGRGALCGRAGSLACGPGERGSAGLPAVPAAPDNVRRAGLAALRGRRCAPTAFPLGMPTWHRSAGRPRMAYGVWIHTRCKTILPLMHNDS